MLDRTKENLAELIGLAQLCGHNARTANSRDVARTLWKMANEYAERAAKLSNGERPNIGDAPALLK